MSGPSARIACSTASAAWMHALPVSPADRAVAPVRVGDVARVAQQRLERRAGGRDAGQRERSERAAVVGASTGDHLAPGVLAPGEVVLARELPGRLDRLGAARGQEQAGETGGRESEDAIGQRERGGVRRSPVRVEAEALELRGGGGADARTVRVADLRREEPRDAVEQAPAVLVDHVRAVAADDHGRRGLAEVRHAGPRQPLTAGGSFDVDHSGGALDLGHCSHSLAIPTLRPWYR